MASAVPPPVATAAAAAALPSASVAALPALQWRYSDAEIAAAPSLREGMAPAAYESALRRGTELIHRLHSRLFRRAETAAIALILLQRFYIRRSVAAHDVLLTAAACAFLASKIDEGALPRKSIVEVTLELLRFREPERYPPTAAVDTGVEAFLVEQERVASAERALVVATEFDFEIDTPWGFLASACKALALPEGVERSARQFAMEMLRSTIPLQHDVCVIAHAAIWAALQAAGIPADRVPGLYDVLSTPVPVLAQVRARLSAAFLPHVMPAGSGGGGSSASGSLASAAAASLPEAGLAPPPLASPQSSRAMDTEHAGR